MVTKAKEVMSKEIIGQVEGAWLSDRARKTYEVDHYHVDVNDGDLFKISPKVEKQLIAAIVSGNGEVKANCKVSTLFQMVLDSDAPRINLNYLNPDKPEHSELINFERYTKEISELTKNNSYLSLENIFSDNRVRCRLFKNIASNLSEVEKKLEIEDSSSINKRNETVYSRPILLNDVAIGHIEYLEDDSKVTILSTEIDYEQQGKGIGTQAYKSFIYDKISKGKIVGSDSIVSNQAIRVYEKLSESGYTINRNETRRTVRGVTTIGREDMLKQSSDTPTIFVDGARVREPGYRMIGDSVFEIHPVKENIIFPDPVEITIYDNLSSDKVMYRIEPKKITKIEQVPTGEAIDSGVKAKIDNLLKSARECLVSEVNADYASFKSELFAWRVTEISIDELDRALKRDRDNTLSI